jgi:hypothetical protein
VINPAVATKKGPSKGSFLLINLKSYRILVKTRITMTFSQFDNAESIEFGATAGMEAYERIHRELKGVGNLPVITLADLAIRIAVASCPGQARGVNHAQALDALLDELDPAPQLSISID